MSLLSPDFDVVLPTLGESYDIIPISAGTQLSDGDREILIHKLAQTVWIEQFQDFEPMYKVIKQWFKNRNIDPELISFDKTGSKILYSITAFLYQSETDTQQTMLSITLVMKSVYPIL